MHSTIQRLLANGPAITDGAWGTQMQARGLASGACPDEWNLSHPELVEQVARAYVEAGSQIVLTNTFRANRLALASYGLAEQTGAINKAGAEISLKAADGKAAVFASIGPSGKMLFDGSTSAEELAEVFAEQAEALATVAVDGLVIETMSDLEEAQIALAAAKQTGLPVVCCMVFDSGKGLDRTMMGATARQVAETLTAGGADVIGANCGQGIASYVDVCKQLRQATDLPIWIKANAGMPEIQGDQIIYRTTAEEFASYGPKLVEAGANFCGGCCGTSPSFITALKSQVCS